MSEKKLKLATVFSGIGSIEFAFKRLNIPVEIVFACDNGEREIEYDKEKEMNVIRSLGSPEEKKNYVENLYSKKTRKHNFVKETYCANYKIKDNMFFQDICLLDGRDFEGCVDLLVGGSPCQSFSSVGSKSGLDDARGTLFYEYARLINEIKPKVFIYENVRNMLKHDNGKTWEIIKKVFDELNYNIDFKILNSLDFNIPQKRNRLFVVGIRKDLAIIPSLPLKANEQVYYSMQDFLINNTPINSFNYDAFGNLLINKKKGETVSDRYFLSNAVKKYVMSPGTKTWYQRVEIDLPIARTILKTMGNCHRAGVDNYVTDRGKIRMLTEREALRLMGYTDDFIMPVSIAQAYKQAGNSIVVDVMIGILKELINEKVFEIEE